MNNPPHPNIDNIIEQTNHLALLLQLYLQDVTAQNQQSSLNDNLKATWVQDSMSQQNGMIQQPIHVLQSGNSQNYSETNMMQSQHSHNMSKPNQIFEQSSQEDKNKFKSTISHNNIKPKQQQLQVQKVNLQELLQKAIQSCLSIVDMEFQIKKTKESINRANSLNKLKNAGQSNKKRKFTQQ